MGNTLPKGTIARSLLVDNWNSSKMVSSRSRCVAIACLILTSALPIRVALAGTAIIDERAPSAVNVGPSAGSGTEPRNKGPARRERSTANKPAAGNAKSFREAARSIRRKILLAPARGPWQWKITKAGWTVADENGFSEFVRKIGETDCSNVHECLTSPAANPDYYDKHPSVVRFFADCADLPFVLRAYYAWHNGLPFSFSAALSPHPRTAGHDTQVHGNQITRRIDIVGPGPSLPNALTAISDFVSAAHFRTPPAYAGRHLPDYYPVRISREGVRAGTVIFDPDGHVAIVYKVTPDGRVLYIDANPDNNLTRGIFDREFARAEPPSGAGFRRWRPQELVGAAKNKAGEYIGGQIRLTSNENLSDWSDEQYYGNALPRKKRWSDAEFVFDGEVMEFHDYVRMVLAYPGFKYDPIDDVRVRIRQLCQEFRYRARSVEDAIKAGIHLRPQPDRLPQNIYATSGEWETFSTPSRDARIKAAFEQLRDEVERFLKFHATRSRFLAYSGIDLRGDLLSVYQAETAQCTISYAKSDGSMKVLTFEDLQARLFRMSFDPYHCVELRWGAEHPNEMKTCPDGPIKRAWYAAEARLRYQVNRTYGERMGWSLEQLRRPELDIGVSEPPDTNVLELLMDQTAELHTD